MAAFSRGFNASFHPRFLRLPSSLRVAIHNARPQYVAPRTPSLSPAFQHAQLQLRHRTTKALGSSPFGSDPIFRTVVQTREPALLYKEPPSRRYLLRVYAFAFLATATGAFNLWWASNLPQDLAFWIPPVYIVIGIAFLGIGIHIFQRPVRRISLLELVPGHLGGRIQLRITARKSPFGKESVMLTDIWEPTLAEKVYPVVEEMIEADRARGQSLSDGLEHMGIVPKAWEYAARWIDQKWTSFFLRFKYFVLQFGITHINLDGVKWKIDCTGYLREEGKAIDRIITVE